MAGKDVVTVRIEYPTPASEGDRAATAAVLDAAAQSWVRAAAEQTGVFPRPPITSPGLAEFVVAADRWPAVAAAIVKARRSAGPGWRTVTTTH